MKRLLIASLVVNLLLGVAAIGWLTWIAAAPKYWFPGAYAQKGERGNAGPRGPRGPQGPAGPVGPDAFDAIAAVSSDLEDLASRTNDLESDLESLSSMSGYSDLETKVEELDTAITDICAGIGSTYYTVGTELDELISNMYSACP